MGPPTRTMVDFRKLDKIWRKRSVIADASSFTQRFMFCRHEHRSDLEWRVKYLREACNALSDVCRSNSERRHHVTDVESTLKTLRDALSDNTKWRSQSDINSANVHFDSDESATGRKPVLLESIISQMCDLYTNVEQERHSYAEQMKTLMGEAKELSTDIRSGLNAARRQYDEAVENHKRIQHSLSRLKHAASLGSTFNDNGERTVRLSNAGEKEYHAARNREVQADHLHCEILKRASMEIEVVTVFIKFIEAEARAMESAAQLFRESIPRWQNQLKEYIFQPVYGLDLDIHLQIRGRPLAYVIEVCVNALSTESALNCEGLFRVTPNALKLKKIVSELNLCAHDGISEDYDNHVVAGALKQYLRDLPRSLTIGPSPTEEWLEAARISDPREHLKAIKSLTRGLPDTYYMNLKFVITFLNKVARHQDVNKMNASNIAICMACSLCFSEGDRRTLSCAPSLVAFLIENYESIFCEDDISSTTGISDSDATVEMDTRSCKEDSPLRALRTRKFSSPAHIARPGKGRAPPPPTVGELSSSMSSLAVNASSNSAESDVASSKSPSLVSFEFGIANRQQLDGGLATSQGIRHASPDNDGPCGEEPVITKAVENREWCEGETANREAVAVETP